ncbi:BtpA/SgcQ family protein [Paraburkholderia sediminicola]|uniref:BtpA/SgcQ family protein n=1 Tax=Paraburkholderia sediminicola TaxID=458836 RepID=UPI0038BACD3E
MDTLDFKKKPVIACVHLLPTLGSHRYDGDVERIYDSALADAKVLMEHGVDAIIVENFQDGPFFPDRVSAETVATLAGVGREIVQLVDIPVGIAILRNDAEAAMAVAAATNASFIRVNVHVGAVLAAQGVLEGKSYNTLRLRAHLRANVAIFADAGVKHSSPWVYPNLAEEVRDLSPHAEAVIVSGSLTGMETATSDVATAKRSTEKPVLIGSGVTPENLHRVFDTADGFIIGSYFKVDGLPTNHVEPSRVRTFMEVRNAMLRASA